MGGSNSHEVRLVETATGKPRALALSLAKSVVSLQFVPSLKGETKTGFASVVCEDSAFIFGPTLY